MRYKRACKSCGGPVSKINKHGYCFKKARCRILGRRAAYTYHKHHVLSLSIPQLKREAASE